jgi:hypothetical protein
MIGWAFSCNYGNRSVCIIPVQQLLSERPTQRPKRKSGFWWWFLNLFHKHMRENSYLHSTVAFFLSISELLSCTTEELITNSDPRRRTLLEEPIFHQQIKKCLPSIEPDVSLLYSQQPQQHPPPSKPYPELDEFSPRPRSYFLNTPF